MRGASTTSVQGVCSLVLLGGGGLLGSCDTVLACESCCLPC